MKKRLFVAAVLLLFIFMSIPASSLVFAHGENAAQLAPLYTGRGQIIPNSYIIVFKPGRSQTAQFSTLMNLQQMGGEIKFKYSRVLNGFAAVLSGEALKVLRANPDVAYIETDAIVNLPDESVYTLQKSGAGVEDVLSQGVQSPVIWGLDRIDQKYLPLSSSYSYAYNGSGVHVYVIDTGIRSTHVEFGGRASKDFDAIGDGQNGNDCHGHGTHVAGTIGGATYGVAKGVTIHGIRVLDCTGTGSLSGVIAGINYVASNRVLPAVANMSLGSSYSKAINDAVSNAINQGVTFVVAAGNSTDNACNYSPASNLTAITVGATTRTDARSSFSNFGACVDLFAPGTMITSAWNTGDTALAGLSGTSMASPHVAGVVALYLQENPSANPATIAYMITRDATTDVVSDVLGAPNKLLFSGSIGLPLPGGTSSPTPTSTRTAMSSTPSPTRTPTASPTRTASVTPSKTKTPTSTITATIAIVGSPTSTNTLTLSPSATVSKTPTLVVTPTASLTKAPTLTKTPTPAGSPSGATLVSPVGSILQSSPTFVWNKVNTASYYSLWVEGQSGVYFQEWLSDKQASCGLARCQFMISRPLQPGVYSWKVQTWNAKGYGAWSSAAEFTYGVQSTPTPAVTLPAPVLNAPLGDIGENDNPMYVWSTVAGATEYYLWVSGAGGPVVQQRYLAGEVACDVSLCSVKPAKILLGGTYTWRVQAKNLIVAGPWSTTGSFVVNKIVPPTATQPVGQAVLLEPVGDAGIPAQPTFKWNKVSGAVYYYLYLTGPSGEIFSTWYSSVQASCDDSTCSVKPAISLGSGQYSWWIRPWSSKGLGPWGVGASFSR